MFTTRELSFGADKMQSYRKLRKIILKHKLMKWSEKIFTFQKSSLLENNQQFVHYLLENTTVSQNEQTGELRPTVLFIDTDEGNNELFYYNQIVVTTAVPRPSLVPSNNTFTGRRIPYPKTLNDLTHGRSSPNDQGRLVAGMLHKKNPHIIRIFTVFKSDDKGKNIKVVGRYQQCCEDCNSTFDRRQESSGKRRYHLAYVRFRK